MPKCIAKGCAKACGEGFLCQQQPDASEKCLLKTDAIVVVTMLKPGANAVASWPRFQHDNKNTGSLTTPIYTAGVCQD